MIRFISRSNPDSNLYGNSNNESAQIDVWFSNCAKLNCINRSVEIVQGLTDQPADNEDYQNGKTAFLKAIRLFENHLEGRDFLVNGRITMADLELVAALYYPLSLIFDEESRKVFPNVERYFRQLVESDLYKASFGTFNWCLAEFPIMTNEEWVASKAETEDAPAATDSPIEGPIPDGEDQEWLQRYLELEKEQLLNQVDVDTLEQLRTIMGDQEFIDHWKLTRSEYLRTLPQQPVFQADLEMKKSRILTPNEAVRLSVDKINNDDPRRSEVIFDDEEVGAVPDLPPGQVAPTYNPLQPDGPEDDYDGYNVQVTGAGQPPETPAAPVQGDNVAPIYNPEPYTPQYQADQLLSPNLGSRQEGQYFPQGNLPMTSGRNTIYTSQASEIYRSGTNQNLSQTDENGSELYDYYAAEPYRRGAQGGHPGQGGFGPGQPQNHQIPPPGFNGQGFPPQQQGQFGQGTNFAFSPEQSTITNTNKFQTPILNNQAKKAGGPQGPPGGFGANPGVYGAGGQFGQQDVPDNYRGFSYKTPENQNKFIKQDGGAPSVANITANSEAVPQPQAQQLPVRAPQQPVAAQPVSRVTKLGSNPGRANVTVTRRPHGQPQAQKQQPPQNTRQTAPPTRYQPQAAGATEPRASQSPYAQQPQKIAAQAPNTFQAPQFLQPAKQSIQETSQASMIYRPTTTDTSQINNLNNNNPRFTANTASFNQPPSTQGQGAPTSAPTLPAGQQQSLRITQVGANQPAKKIGQKRHGSTARVVKKPVKAVNNQSQPTSVRIMGSTTTRGGSQNRKTTTRVINAGGPAKPPQANKRVYTSPTVQATRYIPSVKPRYNPNHKQNLGATTTAKTTKTSAIPVNKATTKVTAANLVPTTTTVYSPRAANTAGQQGGKRLFKTIKSPAGQGRRGLSPVSSPRSKATSRVVTRVKNKTVITSDPAIGSNRQILTNRSRSPASKQIYAPVAIPPPTTTKPVRHGSPTAYTSAKVTVRQQGPVQTGAFQTGARVSKISPRRQVTRQSYHSPGKQFIRQGSPTRVRQFSPGKVVRRASPTKIVRNASPAPLVRHISPVRHTSPTALLRHGSPGLRAVGTTQTFVPNPPIAKRNIAPELPLLPPTTTVPVPLVSSRGPQTTIIDSVATSARPTVHRSPVRDLVGIETPGLFPLTVATPLGSMTTIDFHQQGVNRSSPTRIESANKKIREILNAQVRREGIEARRRAKANAARASFVPVKTIGTPVPKRPSLVRASVNLPPPEGAYVNPPSLGLGGGLADNQSGIRLI